MKEILKDYADKLPVRILEDLEKESEGMSQAKAKKLVELTYESYKNSLIEPGESVGLVSAESIGEPSTQMCVSYDEKAILKYDGSIHVSKIGEFVDSAIESGIYPVGKKQGYEFCDVNNVHVLALNNDEKLEWKAVSKLNRHKSPKRLIKIKTKSGRSITATDFHSFVTRKHNKIVSVAGKDLKVGERLPAIRYLPEHCTEAINVYEYVGMPADDFRVHREYRPTKLLPERLELDHNFGWFIGAYLAEGNAPLGQLCISNLDDNYIENARRFADKIALDYAEKHHQRGFAPSRDFIVNSSLLARFIRNTCGSGSANKRVPEFAFSAKEEFAAGLLRGYFDGDGNVSVDRKMIRASSNSEELLDGIKLLLTRFGIFASKSKDNKQHYLMVPCKYALIFLKRMGSDIKHKREALLKLTQFTENYRDYIDVIGGFDDILVGLSKKLGLPTRYVNSATKRQKIGRTALLRHILRFEAEARNKKIDISSEIGLLKSMAHSDIIWDEIENIEYVETPYDYVYDLTVPELHTFALFDGIVTHNTLNTFHFAGVSEMNVTVGLPRLIEILDGRKNPSTPMMEIYFDKKHIKTVDDIRKMALKIKEIVLREVIDEINVDIFEEQIEIKFNEKKLRHFDLTKFKVAKKIEQAVKKKLKEEGSSLIIKWKAKEGNINELFVAREKLKNIKIGGIDGIKQVLPVKRGDEFVIITAGTNLKKILKMEEVDTARTRSNNVYEIAELFGIEAARQLIVEEAYRVIESQGLNVDPRHIMLVADTMCFTGTVRGVTRYGVVSGKASVLARASFETPIKHILDAAIVGEEDELNSIVENVMLNQPVPVGTGLPSLITKLGGK